MQYHIHHNLGPSRQQAPYVLDIQSPLLDGLATRVVIPLYRSASLPFKPMHTLHPEFSIAGEQFSLITTSLAAMPAKLLGKVMLDFRDQSHITIAALDALVSGV